ncbi:hypothetical protein KP509_09G080200 [Ceratopteris richardii]|nr:hypothetical protein KP509_09G080200 [Ceratopteris richardii]
MPLDKRRPFKGPLSSQFPAKRSVVAGESTMGPSPKRQAMESSSMSSMPSSKSFLSRESSFKSPETGKVKFVSPAALIGTSCEGKGLSPAVGKLPNLAGSSTFTHLNSSANQAAHFSKGCFPNPGNLVNKASTSSQLTNPSMTTPSSSYVSRTPCTSKSSEVLPSFLLPSKSAPSKLQPISKTVKDFPDSFSQGFTKEGIQGSKGVLTARMSTKTSSFKLPKGVVTSESRLKNEVNSDLGKLQSSKVSCSEAVMVKATNNKQDDRSISGKKESACKAAYKAEAKTEPQSHAEICRGISSIDQLGKQELAEGCKALERLSAHSNMPTATCSNETKISSGHISLRKDPQPISAGQDVQIALQHLSSESMVRQESRMPDQHLSMKSLNNTRESTMQSTTLKAEETGSVQQAVYDDHMPQEKHLLEKSPALDFVSCLTLKSRECSSMGSSMYASVPGIHGHHACKDFIDSAKDSGCHVSRTGLSLEGIDMPKSDTSFLDNAVQPLQKTGETYPVTKPLMQMTPQTKLMSVERMVPAQDTGDEVQLQMQEQPRGSIVTSSKLLSVGLDPLLKKDTLDFKEQGADNSIHSSATVNKSAVGSSKVKIIDLNVDHNINSECTAVDTSAYVPDTAVLTPFTAPILPVPSKIKSTARFSDSLGLLSNTTAKVISTITSQTQESGKVYPEAQIVWQGIFDVTSTAGTQVNFYGLQAHPSNCALPKVREVARQLQPSLPLKELPRGSEHNSWPLHFQKVAPNSDNIALYFFASDKESYVQYYKPLVDRLIKFDLTLKGFIEDVELLIFPSSLLPLGSQCWNNFMFLWAVFRARKHPVKQHVVHNQTNGTKEVGRETNLKIAVQSGVPPFSWGNMEDRQVEGSGSKNSDVLQVPVKKTENPPSEIKGVNCERPIMEADPQVVTCQQKEPCRMEVQQPLLEPFSPEEKNTRAKSPSPSNVIVVQGQAADLTPIRFEGIPVAGSDVSLKTLSGLNFDKIDADSKFLASSAVDTNSLNLKGDHGEHVADVKLGGSTAVDTSSVPSNGEHGGTERLKHVGSLMVTSSPPKCPGPTERQDDLWISHRLNSEKGGRDRSHDKFDKPELQRLSKERDRDKPRDREKHKERDKDRSRRFSDYEWERERDKCRDRDRDKDRDRYRDRCKDRERDRERWRERDERERYYRDREWDRDKVGERNKGRERRDRESERERASAREWINRYRYRDVDGNYLRSGRHRYRHPRSHTPSRSPPGSRGRSPLRARGDRYHHRYYRSSCRSRSYSPSSDSDHCLVYTRPDTASRDLSKDSSAHKAKVSAVIAAKEESIVKNYSGKDYGMGDQGNISQRGSNSSSVCREHSIDVGRKFPIADLNLSPYEMEDFEEEVEGEVIMPAEVIEPSTTKNVDYVICNQREIFHHNGRANKETGECSISAGKVVSYQSTEHLTHVSERTDSLSQSLVNDTSGPSLFPVGTSAEGSSSCLQFLPHDLYVEPSTTDLKLALGTKEQEFSETQVELPFYMQLLEPSQGNSRLGSQQPSLDVPMLSGQGELTLSLGIAENPKRALNTNLSLFR